MISKMRGVVTVLDVKDRIIGAVRVRYIDDRPDGPGKAYYEAVDITAGDIVDTLERFRTIQRIVQNTKMPPETKSQLLALCGDPETSEEVVRALEEEAGIIVSLQRFYDTSVTAMRSLQLAGEMYDHLLWVKEAHDLRKVLNEIYHDDIPEEPEA
jgi:hypothetical protein